MGFLQLGKYRTIVLSIALFIVFDTGVLIMNFIIAQQFARDALEVNVAGRQRTLSQQVIKALLQTDNALGSGYVIDQPLAELKGSFRLFDRTLEAFRNGGRVSGPDGQMMDLEALRGVDARRFLDQTQSLWIPLAEALEPILAFDPAAVDVSAELIMSDAGAELQGDLYQAIVMATKDGRGQALLERTNQLTNLLEAQAAARAMRLRIIQVSGIGLALINFFIILFHFIRNLSASDARFEAAKRETDDILETVNEGLFLLDHDYNIGSQHSAALNRIFRREELAGVNFLELMKEIVPETTLTVARDYISLFFGKRENQNLVDDLNPLSEVEVHFSGPDGQFLSRYLGFDFRRVVVGTDLSHLLVSVNDITDRVALERELAEARQQSGQQLDLLMDILHIEPEMLTDFLHASEKSLANVNAILRRPSRAREAYQAKLDGIFREVHTVKGEAAALGLGSVEQHAHDLEDRIAALRERSQISGEDFLPLTIKLDELLGHINAVRELVGKLIDFRSALGRQLPAPVDADDERRSAPRTDIVALLHNLASRAADEQGKRVELELAGLDSREMPQRYRKPVKDIAVQLVRNGIAHGIELPDGRLAAQKPQTGQITLSFDALGSAGYELAYRDDGCGLSLEKIRKAAVEKGFVSADQIDKLDKRQAMSLIFRRGFSTTEHVTGEAGRGIGMDVIRNLVNDLGGKVRISTVEGQYTQFRILLPAIPDDVFKAA